MAPDNTDSIRLTNAQLEHQKLVEAFNSNNGEMVKENKNDSLENLNNILDSNVIDDIYKAAEKDNTVIIAKSSIPKLINNVEEPPKAPLINVPDDVTLVNSKAAQQEDEDTPFILVGSDPASKFFNAYEVGTNNVIDDVFYANRATGEVVTIFKTPEGQEIIGQTNEGEYPLLVLKKKKIYFKRTTKI